MTEISAADGGDATRADTGLSWLAGSVSPLPSAAYRQDSPGGPSASSPTGAAPGTHSGELQPWLVRKRREEADQGLQELKRPRVSALGGLPQCRGPGHTKTPLASLGSELEQQILLPCKGSKLVAPVLLPAKGSEAAQPLGGKASSCRGSSSCSRSDV